MRTLEEVIADSLEPWWRCVHESGPMGAALVTHECRRCDRERNEVAAFLSGPIRGHLVGAIDALPGPHHEGLRNFSHDVREGYLLAIDEAAGAIRSQGGAA